MRLSKKQKYGIGAGVGIVAVIGGAIAFNKLKSGINAASQIANLPPPTTYTSAGALQQAIMVTVSLIEQKKQEYIEKVALYNEKLPQMDKLQVELDNAKLALPALQLLYDQQHQRVLDQQGVVNLYAKKVAQAHSMVIWSKGKIFGETFPANDTANLTDFPYGILNPDDGGRDWHSVACYVLTYGELLENEQHFLSLKAGAELDLQVLLAEESRISDANSDLGKLKLQITALESNLNTYRIAVDAALTVMNATQADITALEERLKALQNAQIV